MNETPNLGAPPPLAGSPRFATTRWSIVTRAGHGTTPEARDALARLCTAYWYPLYAHVRRRGYGATDAQDLTQDFFHRLLRRRLFDRADATRGRFRTFLLTALNHFLADAWAKARAQKRGGSHEFVPLDFAGAERRFTATPLDREASDVAFDRQWAVTLLETVLARLEAEYREAGKAELFAVLRPSLVGPREAQPYAKLGAMLDRSEGAVKVAVHRLRRRYRELLQAEIADTVGPGESVADELTHLFQAVAGGPS